jgi:molybdate transport system substrate-binding protein
MSARSSSRVERRPALAAIAAFALTIAASCGDKAGGGAAATEPIKVAAASDLAKAFEEVGAAYEKQSGKRAVFTFGSTGMFAKQIHEGAPFDVFAAANVKFVDEVVRDGRCKGDTKALYARGRIVLFAKKGSPLPAAIAELADPKFVKVAIANPEHAPYGLAAKQALEKAGVWKDVEKRLVFGENILQTKQFADSGNADVAIVALSLAIGSDAPYVEVPADLHEPLDQALVVCAPDAKAEDAKAFAAFVGSEPGRVIMRRFGFLLPGESVAKSP